MANVNVTYEEMTSQATALKNGRLEIEAKLTELKNQVDNLVAAGFVTDSSSGAFSGAYDEFTTGVKSTVEGLDGMATFLEKAAEAFQNVDSELAGALKG